MRPNYFTCTLGQAASLRIQQPHKTVSKLIEAQASEFPNLPAVGFFSPGQNKNESWDNLIFTFGDIKSGVDAIASHLLASHEHHLSSRQTVGLICPSTPAFLFTWLALIRLGHAVLLIAPQCHASAVADLCQNCGIKILIYDNSCFEQAQEASSVAEKTGHELHLAELALPGGGHCHSDFVHSAEFQIGSLPQLYAKETAVAYLHHTSGTSLGMPKPIPQTHRASVGCLPCFPEGAEAATFTTTPLYHGGIADLFRAWTSRSMIWLFPGKNVSITATHIIRCLKVARLATNENRSPPVKYFSSVPYVLQMMEADARGLEWLKHMSVVGVGGAALPSEVGDRLVEHEINLVSRFGSAECGFLLSSHRRYDVDHAWQYLRLDPKDNPELTFQPQCDDSGLYELVVCPSWPHLARRNRPDGSYATSDLFEPHMNMPNAWRYHSRADSQLMLLTGKKFDPAPLETFISASEVLSNVIIFGSGKPYPGALLFKNEKHPVLTDQQLLEAVWPVVERWNRESPDHARLSKTMLLPMANLQQPLDKSSKGTIIRRAAERRFHDVIENAYNPDQSADGGRVVPDGDLESAITQIVKSVMAKTGELGPKTDLFSFGVDSVAGMHVRGMLRRLLPAGASQLPINVVEDSGTVEKLAHFIRKRRQGETDAGETDVTNELEYMRILVDAHSTFNDGIKDDTSNNGHISPVTEDRDVIVLTGATGALGAHVLDQYRSNEKVKKIYCLVRGADRHAAFERVNKALTLRLLKPLGSTHEAMERIVVLPTALGEPHLGLDQTTYSQIAEEATCIMHVAWSVNFRTKLRNFADNIAGVTNLISLALASARSRPATFAFCSSIASVMAYGGPGPVPEMIVEDPAAADRKGYSRSKWVAEQICSRASQSTKLNGHIKVFRVGQLAGDTRHGVWNAKEAWPMMLSAVKITRALPRLDDEALNWLPVDVAATAIIQGAAASTGGDALSVFHILNDADHPTWPDLLRWLGRDIEFEIIAPPEWVDRLEAAVDRQCFHPATQLLDHWRDAYAREKVADGRGAGGGRSRKVSFARIDTIRAMPVLNNIEPVNKDYFQKLWNWIQNNVH